MTPLYKLFCAHPSISTDTRRILPGSLFFALRGASFDGNQFAAEALERGAAYAVVDDPKVAADERYIVVDNTLTALQQLAHEHRLALGIPILAIAGSNGKTTTKELTARVLAKRFTLYATHGNLNNHIGVPLTLLAMDRSIEFGIVEMGASSCGEIALLCAIAAPNYGILTNVGRAHLEGFGGVEGVRRGKGELFDYLAQHNGTAFVRTEDEVLQAMADARASLQQIRYSEQQAAGIEHHLEGDFNRYNVAAAVAIGRHFGVEEEAIAQAIGSYHPENNRSQRTETERNTLIVDCYNANPSSMQLSVGNLLQEPLGTRSRKVLILGDMRELGSWAEEEHCRIIEQLLPHPQVELILVGEEFGRARSAIGTSSDQIHHYATCEELCAALRAHPLSDALILIKGSHSIGLERTIELL
ncbi:MAG: UDP-N-acetylmuramoyl-tripeptide--D-alanyl-D-alanine ligase [Rikenellaceae bacterium]|nr:UDP-N-acetylmuramoyl-tripeptide--D-alanyl-D-alanine ligase [Rikenellaceae bacterium]